MVFALPRSPLKPLRHLMVHVDPTRRWLRAEDLRVHADAQATLAAAAAQAELITGQAEAALEAERRRGYEEGLEAARLEAAERLIDNVAQQVEFFSRVESRMVDLVMDAVRTIVFGFDDRERLLAVVRNVLAAARSQKQVTLRLPPDQMSVLRPEVEQLKSQFPGLEVLELVADAQLSGDACVLESEVGVVEASLETQVTALRQAFERVLGSRQ